MKRNGTQRAIALICLMAFAVGQLVIGSFAVRCVNATGEARIEFACLKNVAGECVARCESEVDSGEESDHQDSPIPCEDTRISADTVSRVQPGGVNLDVVVVAVLVAVLDPDSALNDRAQLQASRSMWDSERPPDTLARLRTVILLV